MKELNEHADCVLPIDNQVRNDFVVYAHIAYIFIAVLYLRVYIKHSFQSSHVREKNKFKLFFFLFFPS